MRNTQKDLEAHSSAVLETPESSLAARILQAQDDERRRIGRELHDSVGQALVALKMSIVKLKQDQSIAEGSADEVLGALDSVLSEVRTISHLLHPPELDLMGLRASLVWYLQGFQQRTGIQTELDVPEELPALSSSTATALFRVAQECLTNILKHAQASRVTLRMGIGPNELQLEITDNGKGFADLNSCRQGVGILGMQERLAELGGALRIESGHGAGSTVYATIPLIPETSVPIPRKSVPQEGGIRVLVVDDHPAIRYGLRTVLNFQPDIVVCGEASNATQAVELVTELRPDVMVLDLELGNANGWHVVRDLRAAGSPTKILLFSGYAERYMNNPARRIGCSGFLSKGSDPNELIDAIRTVYGGGTFFPESSKSA